MVQQVGVVGLGVMGKSIALNLANHGYEVHGYNRGFAKTKAIMDENHANFYGYETLDEFMNSLVSPRVILMMVPAGAPVDDGIDQMLPYLKAGDVVMDGGNSYFMDTNKRFATLEEKGIHYYGVGVSGGEKGALLGPSIMPSGKKEVYELVGPILENIAAKAEGKPCCTYIGNEGSGHYVKMVHNGIEYADMQLIVEVYLFLKHAAGYSNEKIADVIDSWNHDELKSYLFEITSAVLREKDDVTSSSLVDMILDKAGNKGTGRWTSIEALRQEVNASLLTAAYQARIMSNEVALRKEYEEDSNHEFYDVDLDALKKAYALAKALAFGQGFHLYEDASKKYGWELNYREIASIFRAGCIIQTNFLNTIMNIYETNDASYFASKTILNLVKDNQDALKKVVVSGLNKGLPIPVFTNALLFVNQLESKHLGANLIQGQRDYFGAHTYERIDKEGFEHHEWNR